MKPPVRVAAIVACCALGGGAMASPASTSPAMASPAMASPAMASRASARHASASRASASAPRRATSAKPAPKKPVTAKSPYAGVNRQSPRAVAKAFVRVTFTFDTQAQKSPNASTKRSTLWCTPALRAKMLAELPQGSPGAQWINWTAHKVVTTVGLQWEASDAPPPTTTAAYEALKAVVTPHGKHGWTGTPDHYVVFVTLTRTGAKAPWEVASSEVQQWWPSSNNK